MHPQRSRELAHSMMFEVRERWKAYEILKSEIAESTGRLQAAGHFGGVIELMEDIS
jgi:hypothetical protein